MTHTGRPGEETSDEYATPPSIWRPLARAVNGFDLDPASGAESTPIASTRFTKVDDGLSKSWFGTVWLNPPFGDSSGTGRSGRQTWLRKARKEADRDEVGLITMLLPVDTSTDWFHRHVVDADTICFLSSRPQFQGESVHTGFACMILVYGETPPQLIDALEGMGAVFRGRKFVSSTEQKRLTTDGGLDR
jgi:hypothetical protein